MSHVADLWEAHRLILDAGQWAYHCRAREAAEPVLRAKIAEWKQAGHGHFRYPAIPLDIMFDSALAGRVPVPRQAILFALGSLEDEGLIEPAGEDHWVIR